MNSLDTPKPNDQDRAELQLLYSVSVSDIAFFKQQQWVVTNYTVAIQAAVVAIGKLVGKPI